MTGHGGRGPESAPAPGDYGRSRSVCLTAISVPSLIRRFALDRVG